MHGHSRPVATRTSASPGNLHGKDVHLFALRPHLSTKIAFICTRGGRFAEVAAHADMIDIASFTRLRTAEQVPVRVWSCCTFVVPNRQRLLSSAV